MHHVVRDTFIRSVKAVDSIILTFAQGPRNSVAFKSASAGTTAFPLDDLPPIALDSTPTALTPSIPNPLAPPTETRVTSQQKLAQDSSGTTHTQPPLKPFDIKMPPPTFKGIVRHQNPAVDSAVEKEMPLTREVIPVDPRQKLILSMIAEGRSHLLPFELNKWKILPRDDEIAVAMQSTTGHMKSQDFTMGEYESAMTEDKDGKWASTI